MTLQEKTEIKRLVRAYKDPETFFNWVEQIRANNKGSYTYTAWREAESILLETLGVNKYSSWESFRIARANWRRVNKVNTVNS